MGQNLAIGIGAIVLAFAIFRRRSPEPHVDTSFTVNLPEVGGAVDRGIRAMAEGIARAEGYYVTGSLPNRNHNPGALRVFGETSGISRFASPNEGWAALYRQLERMQRGTSAYYSPHDTIADVAVTWTGGDNPATWARTVAGYMAVTPDWPLSEALARAARAA